MRTLYGPFFIIIYAFCPPALACLNVLASGQSNMCGRGIGGPSALTADYRVQVWNNTNELGADGTEFIPVPDWGNPPWHYSGANNLALWFADSAARELDTCVNLVVVCKGNQSINEWARDKPMYQAILRNYQASGIAPAPVFLWLHGGADANMSTCAYKIKLTNIIGHLKADGILAPDAMTLVGEGLNPESTAISEAQRELANMLNDMRFVEADGLYLSGGHYTGGSLGRFGVKYWDELNK